MPIAFKDVTFDYAAKPVKPVPLKRATRKDATRKATRSDLMSPECAACDDAVHTQAFAQVTSAEATQTVPSFQVTSAEATLAALTTNSASINPGAPESTAALRHLNLEIADGEFLAVVGHTGSGKSTFIRHLNGLLIPTSGAVEVNGLSTAIKEHRARIREQVGVVFQYPNYQLFADTVANDIAYGPRKAGVSESEIEARISALDELLHLDYASIKDKSPFELSGGQARKVALAGMLVMEPKVLVLDEPMAALDPHSRNKLKEILLRLRDQGITLILVSHSMDDAASLADRILVLDHGTAFALGTPQEIFAPANACALRRIGLGLPAPAQFALDLQEAGFPLVFNSAFVTDTDALAQAIACELGFTLDLASVSASAPKCPSASASASAPGHPSAPAPDAAEATAPVIAQEVTALDASATEFVSKQAPSNASKVGDSK